MILKEKAAKWNADSEIQGLLKIINADDVSASKLTKKYTSDNAKKLLAAPLDRVALAEDPLPYEQLDQLTMEVIMGIR
jgi:xylose isomerase